MIRKKLLTPMIGFASISMVGCQPTVQLQAPDKPIVVNMNVDVKLKVEQEVQTAMKQKPDIF